MNKFRIGIQKSRIVNIILNNPRLDYRRFKVKFQPLSLSIEEGLQSIYFDNVKFLTVESKKEVLSLHPEKLFDSVEDSGDSISYHPIIEFTDQNAQIISTCSVSFLSKNRVKKYLKKDLEILYNPKYPEVIRVKNFRGSTKRIVTILFLISVITFIVTIRYIHISQIDVFRV